MTRIWQVAILFTLTALFAPQLALAEGLAGTRTVQGGLVPHSRVLI